jgi:hypothetical protein
MNDNRLMAIACYGFVPAFALAFAGIIALTNLVVR